MRQYLALQNLKVNMSKSNRMEVHVIAMIAERTSQNPIYSKEIERRLGVSGVIVRDVVHRGRTEENLPICGESKGYFMAGNKIEAERTIRSLYSRAKQLREAAEGMERYYIKDSQMSLI